MPFRGSRQQLGAWPALQQQQPLPPLLLPLLLLQWQQRWLLPAAPAASALVGTCCAPTGWSLASRTTG